MNEGGTMLRTYKCPSCASEDNVNYAGCPLPPFTSTEKSIAMPHFTLMCCLELRLVCDPLNYLSRQELSTQTISLRNIYPNPNPMLSPYHTPKQDTHWIVSKFFVIIDGSPD